jgi:hypothetical protein
LGESIRRPRIATSNSQLQAAVVVSPAPPCTFSPDSQPSRARTNAPISAPRMPKHPTLHPPPLLATRNALPQFVAAAFTAPSSFLSTPLSQTFPQVCEFSSYLGTSAQIALAYPILRKLSQPATPWAVLTHFEIAGRSLATLFSLPSCDPQSACPAQNSAAPPDLRRDRP